MAHACAILEQEKQQLMKQLFEREETILLLQKHLQIQANQHRSKCHVWEQATTAAKSEIAALNQQVSELLDVVKTNKDEIDALKQRVSRSTTLSDTLQNQLREVAEELEEYKSENSQLAQELKQLKFIKRPQKEEESTGYATARNPPRSSSCNRNKSPLKSACQNARVPLTSADQGRKLSAVERSDIIERLKLDRKNLPRTSHPQNQDFEFFLHTLRRLQ